ncbi:MAG: hypothetical protein ACTSUE_22915 [Promethearchaeota archaeon]
MDSDDFDEFKRTESLSSSSSSSSSSSASSTKRKRNSAKTSKKSKKKTKSKPKKETKEELDSFWESNPTIFVESTSSNIVPYSASQHYKYEMTKTPKQRWDIPEFYQLKKLMKLLGQLKWKEDVKYEPNPNDPPVPDYLSSKHAFPRDQYVKFRDSDHLYWIWCNKQKLWTRECIRSGSGLDDMFKDPFKSLVVAKRIARSQEKKLKQWEDENMQADAERSGIPVRQALKNHFGQRKYMMKTTADEILAMWNENASLGTEFHLYCELYYNKLNPKVPEKFAKEWGYFLKFAKHMEDEGYEPWLTEWRLWCNELRVAGTADMLYKKKGTKNRFVIVDWKRVDDIWEQERSSVPGNYHEPLQDVQATKCNKYFIQINSYAWLAETLYNIEVEDMFMVVFHPSNPSYLKVRVPVMTNIIIKVMLTRAKRLIKEKAINDRKAMLQAKREKI